MLDLERALGRYYLPRSDSEDGPTTLVTLSLDCGSRLFGTVLSTWMSNFNVHIDEFVSLLSSLHINILVVLSSVIFYVSAVWLPRRALFECFEPPCTVGSNSGWALA